MGVNEDQNVTKIFGFTYPANILSHCFWSIVSLSERPFEYVQLDHRESMLILYFSFRKWQDGFAHFLGCSFQSVPEGTL